MNSIEKLKREVFDAVAKDIIAGETIEGLGDVGLVIDHLHAAGLLMMWLPIETAPRDGTKFDMWVDYPDGGERYPEGYFDKNENAFCLDITHKGQRIVFTATPPTHWMPKPPEPEKEGV